MGLCKCPKRKATNLFCFEHRVNVCEHCLVDVHEACVVQTYLSWLTDSDYDTKCLLCSDSLASKETIRLKCLHNFHWSCLSNRVGNMPEGTPSSAFKCPSCLDTIFPAINQTSPIIDRLREKLSTVNWGRVGLGMVPKAGLENVSEIHAATPKRAFSVEMPFDNVNAQTTSRVKQASEQQRFEPLRSDVDHQDTKYLKRSSRMSIRIPKTIKRLLIAALILGGFYLILMTFGRESSDNDQMFDPHSNPNIRVENNH